MKTKPHQFQQIANGIARVKKAVLMAKLELSLSPHCSDFGSMFTDKISDRIFNFKL